MGPVIVAGMHRSGTTLISKALQHIGVSMGATRDENEESVYFQGLNVWMLESAGARWDLPQPWRWALSDGELLGRYAEYLRIQLRSPRSVRHLGLAQYLRWRGLVSVGTPWGWKDPRNVLTLPVWLDVFRDRPKVIYVRRHGMDVASSLLKRHRRYRQYVMDVFDSNKRFPPVYWIRPKRGAFVDSNRCTSLEGAFSLWIEYCEFFDKMRQTLSVPVLDIKYETFLDEPSRGLRELAGFCGVKLTESAAQEFNPRVAVERAYAYRQTPTLVEFAARRSSDLARFGYS